MAVNPGEWLELMENSAWAVNIRQSTWLYPAIEIIHIIGIVLVAGGAVLFDLRLLGFSKKIPVPDIAGHLLPWSRRGLLLAVPSGILLFITNAKTLGFDPAFHVKLILLALAGVNAWIFHTYVFRPHNSVSTNSVKPNAGKVNAVCSIILWTAIIACGRLLAY